MMLKVDTLIIYFFFKFFSLNSEKCDNILVNSNSNFHIQDSDEVVLCSSLNSINLININNICLDSNDVDEIYKQLNCFENNVDCKKLSNFEYLSACDKFKSNDDEVLSCLYFKIDNICLHFENILLKTSSKFNYTECIFKRNFIAELFLSLKFDKNYCFLQSNEILFTSIPYSELAEKGNVDFGMFLL